MKKFTRERVVPTISASISWLMRGSFSCRAPPAQPQQRARQPLLSGVEMMIAYIAEIAAIAHHQKVHERPPERRILAQPPPRLGGLDPLDGTFAHRGDRADERGAFEHGALAEEFAGAEDHEDGLAAGLRQHMNLGAAAVEKVDRFAAVALPEHDLIGSEAYDRRVTVRLRPQRDDIRGRGRGILCGKTVLLPHRHIMWNSEASEQQLTRANSVKFVRFFMGYEKFRR